MEAMAVYDFWAQVEDESFAVEGDTLSISKQGGDQWWKCRNVKGKRGCSTASCRGACSDLSCIFLGRMCLSTHRRGSVACSVHKTRRRGRCAQPSARRG